MRRVEAASRRLCAQFPMPQWHQLERVRARLAKLFFLRPAVVMLELAPCVGLMHDVLKRHFCRVACRAALAGIRNWVRINRVLDFF